MRFTLFVGFHSLVEAVLLYCLGKKPYRGFRDPITLDNLESRTKAQPDIYVIISFFGRIYTYSESNSASRDAGMSVIM